MNFDIYDLLTWYLIKRYIFVKLCTLQMSFHISKIHFDIFIHSNRFPYAQYFPVDLMDLLFNQEKKFYNNTLAETSAYHLLTSMYYRNSLNLSNQILSLATAEIRQCWALQVAFFF